MAQSHGVHWVAPASMLSFLVLALATAVGHHLFYWSLKGTPAPDSSYDMLGTHVSKQQFNIAVGTAFAYFFKAFLVLAMSIAFLQAFWKAAQGHAKGKAVELGHLDSAHSAIDNLLVVFNPMMWWRYPLPLVIALTAWLTPIASILTPSTLTIRNSSPVPHQTSLTQVPNLDFSSLNFLGQLYPISVESDSEYISQSHYPYPGPSLEVLRCVETTMTTGEVQSIPAPSLNASWTLRFHGPEIRCNGLDAATRSDITNSFVGVSNATTEFVPYASWLTTNDSALPFLSTGSNGTGNFRSNPDVSFSSDGFQANQTLVVGSSPNSVYQITAELVDPTFNSTNSAFFRCRFYNSSYEANFTYVDGVQHVAIDTDQSTTTALQNNPLGLLMSQWNGTYSSSCFLTAQNRTENEAWPCLNSDNLDQIQLLAYQAVLDAFVRNVVGYIMQGTSANGETTSSQETRILDTGLLNTPVIQSVVEALGNDFTTSLQSNMQQGGFGSLGTSLVSGASPQLSYLMGAMEEMFRNATVSLMSSSLLRTNYSSMFAPPLVNVTFTPYYNYYEYSYQRLWLAYGIALLFGVLIVIVGLTLMVTSQATYSSNFSTIFRIGKGAVLDTDIKSEDLDGQDPLPEYLSRAHVRFAAKSSHKHKTSADPGKVYRNASGASSSREPSIAAGLLDEREVRIRGSGQSFTSEVMESLRRGSAAPSYSSDDKYDSGGGEGKGYMAVRTSDVTFDRVSRHSSWRG